MTDDLKAFEALINHRLDRRIEDIERRIDKSFQAWKAEVHRHFEVVSEQLRGDVLGAFRDFTSMQQEKHQDHERRIRRLESSVGLSVS